MSGQHLTLAERSQLRTLKAVYDNPTIAAVWRKNECDSLVRLGLAQRHEVYPQIQIVSITEQGLEVAATLDQPQRIAFDPNETHEADAS